jgi:hypothetical protein
MLTVWRTLWVELDSMGSPDAPGISAKNRGTFVGEPGHMEDDVKFTPGPPDISFLVSEFEKALIAVKQLPSAYDTRDDLPFVHNLDPSQTGFNDFNSVRDVVSHRDFLSAHIIGVYELHEDWDYDGTNKWHIGQSYQSVVIPHEVIRDVAATHPGPLANGISQSDIERRIVLHEVLHRYFGAHQHDHTSGNPPPTSGLALREYNLRDEGIMDTMTILTKGNTDNELSPIQIRFLQDPTKEPEF